jgi:hypothetical protein
MWWFEYGKSFLDVENDLKLIILRLAVMWDLSGWDITRKNILNLLEGHKCSN